MYFIQWQEERIYYSHALVYLYSFIRASNFISTVTKTETNMILILLLDSLMPRVTSYVTPIDDEK